MSQADIFAFIYLIASVLFILGLKGLSSPLSALKGNYSAIAGMAIAILAVLFDPAVRSYGMIVLGIMIGAAIGLPIAKKVEMKSMPQLVALLHSFVGLAAVLVDTGTAMHESAIGHLSFVTAMEAFIGAFIGAITFSGSVIAFGKLQGILSSAAVTFKGQHKLNLLIFFGAMVIGLIFAATKSMPVYYVMLLLSFVLGVTLIIPVGGADMPVIVSMLNSYSGWAAVATGFMLQNNLLIVTGSVIGASGAILSYIMCKAMNRSIINVVLGGFGSEGVDVGTSSATGKAAKQASVDDAVFMMQNAGKVIIIPGYGMAIAQAQYAVKDFCNILIENGVDVKFAVHPVAGRMPGHMNVLLAEADVSYDLIFELDDINNEFPSTDVVLVLGANDIINPAAKTDKASPIYGMPILEAYKSKMIFVIKRSMKSGYAGIENELYYRENCMMLFGDAKKVCDELVNSLNQ